MSRTAVAGGSADMAAGLRATLASLPESFVLATPGAVPDLVVIDGAGGWALESAEAIRRGARAVVVVDPAVTDVSDVDALILIADRRRAVVELAERHAGDPALPTHARELRNHFSAARAVLVTQISPTLRRPDAALGVVRTLRALGLPAGIDASWETSGAVLLRGSAGGRPFEASVSRSTVAARQRVQALGVLQTVDLTLHGEATARPADIVVSSIIGALRLPTVYETASRAAWRRARTALVEGTHDHAALRGLAEDLAVARQA